MFRNSIILILITTLIGACTRDNKTSRDQDSVKISVNSLPASFDPVHASDDPSTQILQLFYEPLLIIAQENQEWPKTIPGALAVLPEVSQDGKEFRLQLKDGIKFAASEEFKLTERIANSKDLAVTLLRNADPDLHPRYSALVEEIDGVKSWWKGKKDLSALPAGIKIIDDKTLLVRLIKSTPHWWYGLSAINFSLVPAETFGRAIKTPPVNANYKIVEITESLLRLVKTSGSGPKEISYHKNTLEESVKLLKEGQIDICPILPDQATTWLEGTQLKKDFKDNKLYFGSTSQYTALLMNPSLAGKTKHDIHARFNQHVDRVRAAISLGPLLNPCNSLYRCDAELPSAKAYEGKEMISAKVIVSPEQGNNFMREELVGLLKDAGISAKVEQGTVSSTAWNGDLALIDLSMVTYDPSDLLNIGRASSDIKQKLGPQVANTAPTAKALESLSVWTRDEAEVLVLARRRSAAVTDSRVKGVKFNIHGWLDPRHIEIGK